MSQEMVVLQGNMFKVELQSMLGSTNYGWCVTKLPEGIVLLYTEIEPAAGGLIAPAVQRFWFGAVSETEEKAEIEFAVVRLTGMSVTEQKHTVSVTVIPGNSEEFAKYSENGIAAYGCAGGAQDTVVKYGYPCGAQDAAVKYGYPCGVQDTVVKYGYPCGVQDAAVKYGYPCGAQDTAVKYGYPCGVQDASENACPPVIAAYSYPGMLYGYPLVKYSYPLVKYSYPVVAYGYPGCC